MRYPSYDQIREQVERRYRRLSYFVFHIIMAITSVAVIWAIDPTPQDGTPVLAALWFGVLVCHAVKIYMDGLRDQAVERAWERYAQNTPDIEFDSYEKPKRPMRLTDDAPPDEFDDEDRSIKGYSSNSQQ